MLKQEKGQIKAKQSKQSKGKTGEKRGNQSHIFSHEGEGKAKPSFTQGRGEAVMLILMVMWQPQTAPKLPASSVKRSDVLVRRRERGEGP